MENFRQKFRGFSSLKFSPKNFRDMKEKLKVVAQGYRMSQKSCPFVYNDYTMKN